MLSSTPSISFLNSGGKYIVAGDTFGWFGCCQNDIGKALSRMGNGSRLALLDMGFNDIGTESLFASPLLLLLLALFSLLFMFVAFIFKFETSMFIMQSFFLAFVFVLFRDVAEFKLFNKFEHVSVFFSFGMVHLLDEDASFELTFKFEILFELLLLLLLFDAAVSILIVWGWVTGLFCCCCCCCCKATISWAWCSKPFF